MLRKPKRSLLMLIFGAIFAGVGIFLWQQAEKEGFMLYFMASVFGAVGWSIVLGGFYSAFNSLEVLLDGREIVSRRLLFGMIIKKARAGYADIDRIMAEKGLRSSRGRRHYVEYAIKAHGNQAVLLLAEQLASSGERDKALAYFEKEILGRRSH